MLIERDRLSVAKQCGLLEANRSGLYYAPVPESAENLSIMRQLDEQYLKTPFYGVERLLVLLVGMGHKLNRKRARRLMGLMGWQTLYQHPRTTHPDPAAYKYPYLLRHLAIERKNQAWAVDITYIPMKNGFMYLCAIIDIHTRYVTGWGVSNSMTAEWCSEVVKEAIAKHGKPEILNSDQGSQFTSDTYTSLLKDNGIQISMDGRGRALDNIFIERLWRTIKYEHIYLHVYTDGLDLYKGLQGFMDFYNNERAHQSLNYRTPENSYQNAA